MAARPLLIHPDPALRRPALPVTVFDAATRAVAGDVLDTLRAVGALGLTAPHVGDALRIVVIRLQPDLPAVTYLNPEILWASPERATQDEGSVCMPGITEPVERPARIRLRYADLDGHPAETEADGFLAACLQHEVDQLDGVFWIERLTRLRRERALRRYGKLRRRAEGAASPGA